MNDITHKTSTLREALAEATVLCSKETLERIKQNRVPKGNILEFARAAGFFGAKKTEQLLPHCHPVTIDGLDFDFELTEEGIRITGWAKSIGRTGIEMEILTGVSIAALTMYDMLKPIDKQLSITNIRLLEKKGGKSDREKYFKTPPSCAIVVCSSEIQKGTREDHASPIAIELLAKYQTTPTIRTVGSTIDEIQKTIKALSEEGMQFIFTIGGTGLSEKDTTVEAVAPLLDQELAGIVDAMRWHGYARNPLAMTSKLIAGNIGKSTIITLPGSQDGVRECLEALLPTVFKVAKML
jgi:cyclic pyranopterin monophosphate synthase